jgi:hypothetical protein
MNIIFIFSLIIYIGSILFLLIKKNNLSRDYEKLNSEYQKYLNLSKDYEVKALNLSKNITYLEDYNTPYKLDH